MKKDIKPDTLAIIDNTHTHIHTNRHGDSMTTQAKGGESVKIFIKFGMQVFLKHFETMFIE